MNLVEIRSMAEKMPKYKTAFWVTAQEGQLLQKILRETRANTYIEIGTANGYSTAWAATVIWDSLVHIETYDPVDRPKVWDKPAFELRYTKDFINFIQAPFKAERSYIHPIVFFVDGCHSQKGIREDWNEIKGYLTPKDTAIFHDVRERPIQKFIDRLDGKEWLIQYHHTQRVMATVSLR